MRIQLLSRHRHGLTLLELVMVIVIIAILVGLLLTTSFSIRRPSSSMSNGNCMKQIVTAMIAYLNDHDGAWPCALGGVITPTGTTSADCRLGKSIAYASFENLAFHTQLPNRIFSRKVRKTWLEDIFGSKSEDGPTGFAVAQSAPSFTTSTWADRTGAGPSQIAWAYDWATPTEVASYRVIVADRGNWHKTRVVSIAADSSLKLLTSLPGPADTCGMGTSAVDAVMGATVNPDATGCGTEGKTTPTVVDTIYSGANDGLPPGAPGNYKPGDNRRAWVR